MKKNFGILPTGEQATLYTISCGSMSATVTDYGAALVSLLVPDRDGNLADVVLGFDDANGYRESTSFLGATVGRNCNRLKDASFCLGGREYKLTPNEGNNNLHSGPDCFHLRLWKLINRTENRITFSLESPDGDQGFPGKAVIWLTYELDGQKALHITYNAICHKDTVFNMTNHSYFNLAGHDHPEQAMEQILTIPGRYFNPDDAENIPTGEQRCVVGTPFDFRAPKVLRQDIDADYEPLHLQGGYDHNFEVFCNPCAILRDPVSGRTMSVYTDRPGVQLYTGNFLDDHGKDGVYYGKRSGVALETQFCPDSLHHPDWPQPIVRAGEHFRSETCYQFE